ncbi:MAG: hypothetical protein DRP84_12035 [Spirochaetes bacterium]|nr:MAG: hypothetical protein DRP84_12035 [Spirochaetota bacterium]
MKIAHIIPGFIPEQVGGAEVSVHNLATTQVNLGHDVYVLTYFKDKKSYSEVYRKVNYKLLRLKRFPQYYRIYAIHKFYDIYQFFRYIRKYHFDVCHFTMGFPYALHLVDVSRRMKIPSILRCVGEDIQINKDVNYGYRQNEKINRAVLRKYKMFDALIAASASVKNEYLKIGIPEQKIFSIPNGVYTNRFREKDKYPKSAIMQYFNLSYDTRIILTVGRNHPKKGLTLIPKVIEYLSQITRNFVWIIIGKRVKELEKVYPTHIKKYVLFLDETPEIFLAKTELCFPDNNLIGFYINADIFVLPSIVESFGIVLIEAMSAGKPVVVWDVDGCKDLIQDGINGFKISLYKYREMAEKIALLLKDKYLYSTISCNALKWVEQNGVDWGIIAERYVNLYNALLHQKSG